MEKRGGKIGKKNLVCVACRDEGQVAVLNRVVRVDFHVKATFKGSDR